MSKIGKEFVEKTKYRYLTVSDQEQGLAQPPLELEYPGEAVVIGLPDPDGIQVKPVALREAIERRKSIRDYTPDSLTLEELSYLLWCTQGVKDISSSTATFRTVPSAGARHPLETFLLANRISGLRPGIYRYLALEHKLLPVNLKAELAEAVTEATGGQSQVAESAVTFIWTAVAYRMTWRYGQRGYRYILLDAGHACQNLYLSAQAVDCGVCGLGFFDDDALNTLLALDGEEHFAVYLASVGRMG